MKTVAIVGGGISGLAAAFELSDDPDLEITVHEASPRVGGKIQTSEFVGRLVDEGADAFLRRVPDALRLCEELGLTDLVSPAHGTARVWIDGQLRALPGGLVLGVPARFDELAESGILTHWGLARARTEPELAGEPLVGDTSIGALIGRRYGTEVAERLVGPLLGGINAGSIDDMSLDAVVPQLAAAAHRSASLTTALAETLAAAPGDAGPVFAAPDGGMARLIDALAARLTADGVELRCDAAIETLPDADGVVLTTPANVSARLLAERSPGSAAILGAIRYASVVFTALAFDRVDLPDDLDASGFLVPREAGLTITAASWSSTKWARLAGDPVILRISMGHADDPEPIELSDEQVLDRIAADLATTMGVTASPVAHRIIRYRDGFPQYAVGHLDRIAELEATLERDAPDLAVSGMAHRGVGIPACIREARLAASRLRDRLARG